jgi:selenocysteine-specific elongation factor
VSVVVGTAGHIDHGKTTLLRALTGIDADRLPEERARGMTIDVGYAHLALPDGTELDFVDVPGHDRLVGNMLVGAGEIDAALLVIAADDGPRPQTLEHLELLDGLGIADGLVAVTKADAVDPERVGAVVDAARALVAPTRLAGIDIVSVSATTGDGLDAVRLALVALRDRVEAARQPAVDGPSRLAIDRVFSIRGRGTVVTGTLRGAPIERGAILRVVPGTVGRTVRVREVQVHGRTVDGAGPGRVALNVAGAGSAGLERGWVLTTEPAVVASDRLLVALHPVALHPVAGNAGRATKRIGGIPEPGSQGRLPADRTPVALHLGTARVAAVVGRSGRDAIDLGAGQGSAILRLERPIALAPGDRFGLRRLSPVETLGGGRVLDPRPARGIARRRASPERVRALAVAPAGSDAWRAARLELHGVLEGPPATVAADVADELDGALVDLVERRPAIRIAELTRAIATRLRRRVGGFGSSAEVEANATHRIVTGRLDTLVAEGRVRRDADRILPPGVAATGPSAAVAAAMERLVTALSTAGPPPLADAAREAGCPPEGIRLLEQANRIVRLEDDLAWAEPTWRDLAGRALAMAEVAPLAPAAYRDATGSSRKFVMALLEDLDRRAILRRTPAGHVPGPRASTLAAGQASPDAPEAVVRPDASEAIS